MKSVLANLLFFALLFGIYWIMPKEWARAWGFVVIPVGALGWRWINRSWTDEPEPKSALWHSVNPSFIRIDD
ncbi:hypothetical protein EON81_22285 [bacterium]|nr:MAG: hypothetical protein EON81_22285 [bacterium]